MTAAGPATCPSARAEPGALLWGVVGRDGRVGHLGTPVPVDPAFVAQAAATGPPEARFRFATACAEGACRQWTGSACGIIERVLRHLAPDRDAPMPRAIPRCALRPTCRWWAQRGRDACRACTVVVTDQSALAAPAPDRFG